MKYRYFCVTKESKSSVKNEYLCDVIYEEPLTCMCSSVSLQIKGIIESFSAESAQVSLCIAVTLHVAIKESLQGEHLGTESTLELGGIYIGTT